MKICTVVLTYDAPLYNFFDTVKRQYLESKGEDFLFVYNGVDTSKHNLPNKTYNYHSEVYHPSGIPVMLDKFIQVAKDGLLQNYDYVIRVNSSTFVNTDVVKEILKPHSKQLYMGFYHPDWNFCSGACTVYSKDVLECLVCNHSRINRHQEDDVAIGNLLRFFGIQKTFLDRACFESHIQDTHITTPPLEEIAEAIKKPQI